MDIAGVNRDSDDTFYTPGSSFFYLNLLLIAKKEDSEQLRHFLIKYRDFNDDDVDGMLKKVLDSYKKIKTTTNKQ